MGLISKTAKAKWNSSNKKYYEKLGYVYTKIGDEFEVKIEDLTKGSHSMIECMCDNCKKIIMMSYNSYNSYKKDDNKYYCNQCSCKLFGRKNQRITILKNSKSFKQWCIENNREDVLDRWDYELNDYKPDEITYASNKSYWFKCDKYPEHKSELKRIINFVHGHEGSICCKQCNSIARYILDNFPNKKLEDVWDFEKNGDLNPWYLSYGCHKKIWIKCQEKDYHESYDISCNRLSSNYRCPYCRGMKVHYKDSLGQYITDNFGEEFLNKIWSDNNVTSPFEYSCGSQKKVWWNCIDDKHNSYLRPPCDEIRYKFRCPNCVQENTESLLEESVRLYLEKLKYNVLCEHNCTIKLRNPKTKMPLLYDNEINLSNDKQLIIEVHGGQHYKYDFYKYMYKCSEEEAKQKLYQRQLYDRYKRVYAIQHGYNYLEIPYTAFDSKDTYKKLIDDKIKEILNKNY